VHRDGPFATLIAVAAKRLARREDDEEMRMFKSGLREAPSDPGELPGQELSDSVEYDHGSDKAFLRWLWHELYAIRYAPATLTAQLLSLVTDQSNLRRPESAGRTFAGNETGTRLLEVSNAFRVRDWRPTAVSGNGAFAYVTSQRAGSGYEWSCAKLRSITSAPVVMTGHSSCRYTSSVVEV
jgi:hypothetical protein